MAYTPREIKDRVAVGDDIFIVEDLGNNRIRLIPAPTHVSEPGTPVNKELLQPIEDYLATIATKGYVDSFVMSLQAGTAFAYYLIPPNVYFSSANTGYEDWWIRNEFRSAVACILLPGTIRYHLEYRSGSSSYTCYVRVLLNGSQIREVSTKSTSWQTVTGNITVNPGDIVTIQKRSSSSSLAYAYWRNVCIQTAQPTLGIQLSGSLPPS